MQRICWILALTIYALLNQTAMAKEPAKETGTQLPEPPTIGLCAMPGGGQTGIVPEVPYRCNCQAALAYSLAPGCCEARRHCFDNAWDGYCQERARHDAFWSKVGTGAFCPCTPRAAHDDRGAALEVQLWTAASAAGCQKP